MSKAEPKTISHDDYLRFLGLVTLAADHNKAARAIERSAGALLGIENEGTVENPYFGHVSDVLYGNRDTDDMLRILNITVASPVSK